MDIMRAALVITLGGNAFVGLGKLQQGLEKMGLITDQNRYLWRGFALDISKAGIAAGIAYKSFKSLTEGVESLAGVVRDELKLKVALEYKGESPDVLAGRFEKLKNVAIESAQLTGTPRAEARAALNARLGYVGQDFEQRGGGVYGRMLESAIGLEPGEGAAEIKRMLETYKRPQDRGHIASLASLIYRTQRVAGLEDPHMFLFQLQRINPTIAGAGGSEKNAMLLLAMFSRVREMRPGMALESFLTAADDPKRRALAHQYGLDIFGGGAVHSGGGRGGMIHVGRKTHGGGGGALGPGGFRDAEDLYDSFVEFQRKVKSPQKQQEILKKIFGPAGLDVAQAFTSANPRKMAHDISAGAGLEIWQRAMRETFEFQRQVIVDNVAAIKQNLHRPAEEWFTRGGKKLAPWIQGAEEMSKQEGFQNAFSGGELALGALAAAGTLFFGGRGLLRGARAVQMGGGFSKLFGAGAVTAGIYEGKALKATIDKDLMNVFVVNWPGQLGGSSVPISGRGLAGGLESGARELELAGGGAVPALSRAGRGGIFYGGTGVGQALTLGTGLAATAVLAVGAAAILAIKDQADRTCVAWDVAGRQAGQTANIRTKDLAAAIAANIVKRDKTLHPDKPMTPQQVHQEVVQKLIHAKPGVSEANEYTKRGFWDNFLKGVESIFSSHEALFSSMNQKVEAMPDSLDVRVTVDDHGTRAAVTQHRRTDGVP